MMGRQDRDQGQLFYEFSLDEMIPTDHLLRRINVFTTAVLADLHYQLKRFYSDIGREQAQTLPQLRSQLRQGIFRQHRPNSEVKFALATRYSGHFRNAGPVCRSIRAGASSSHRAAETRMLFTRRWYNPGQRLIVVHG
jgi:hypothetical protein